MKVIVAPDKFRGSLTAARRAEAIAVGLPQALGAENHAVTRP
jgi:glycerate kinase